ncbi:MAG: relaxase/mobilization nuclease domain-containing protein [Eubacteriales bacterium]|nr:relaxase/mobilization nuclease domain-containing protein [Eubacteriales bacterium]
MAVSGISDVHVTPGKTLSYVGRPDKSEDGTLVFSSLCSNDPKLAHIQMKAHRKRFGKDKGVLLHHGYVSFKKDEISKEKAYEFAQEFMKRHYSDYQYFGSVHVDTDKIHFNFTINSVGLDGKKYSRNMKRIRELRAEVDRCCEEYNLSVVIPKGMGMSYKEWMEQKKNNSWKSIIKSDIDEAILKADSFEHFLALMRDEGYYVKHGSNVKHILFKKKGMQRGSRGKTLGDEYTEQAIKDRIKFKEFNFTPGSSLRKPRRRMKLVERELMSLYYRRPTLATNVAIGIYLLNAYVTGERYRIMRYSPPKKNKISSIYNVEVKKLAAQLRFCHEHGIRTREDLESQIADLEKQIQPNNSAKQKELLAEYYALKESLEEIRDRNIIEKIQREVEKEKHTPEKER